MTNSDLVNPSAPVPDARRWWLGLGLFFATLATLLLETLDARLLSVLTWYHLSFFAVSVAMLGMAAGAVFVFVSPDRFAAPHAPRALARLTLLFACTIPVTHIANLSFPFLPLNSFSVMEMLSVVLSTTILTVPFAVSGMVVTIALTRSGGAIGRLYACDLIGAALGCLLVVPILDHTNISSATFLAGTAAAVSAACFHRFAGIPGARRASAVAAGLLIVAVVNATAFEAIRVLYPKNRQLWFNDAAVQQTAWNSHSYVIVQRPSRQASFFWAGGPGVERYQSELSWLVIDGEAGTAITKWDGDPASLEWVSHDLTTLPYHLRRSGDVAVIGVGGGRDVLAAIWARSRSVIGIDVNSIVIDTLTGTDRDFAGIANRPEVTLVHDEGRAYVTRAGQHFDVLQMSLVDTWAATGAGAFTLSENGLYTRQAWRVFLDRLKPGGIFSVSRWFDVRNVSETSRLLALGVAALLDRGVDRPRDHFVLTVRGGVATLMLSTAPFTLADRDTLTRVTTENEFRVLESPWTADTSDNRLDRIAHSRSMRDLDEATSDRRFDYRPPTDQRPYYFNMLKPGGFLRTLSVPKGGVLGGNLRATATLLVLQVVASLLVLLIIVWPLLKSGRPAMSAARFSMTMAYFGAIGFGYMLIQIALLQRFSIYLGHPTYTLSIILFSMLLFTGVGSLASDRLELEPRGWFRLVPFLISVTLVAIVIVQQPVMDRTILWSLPARTAVVLAFSGPVSMLLGCCFPIGARLNDRTPALTAWMWGINGACGVLASVSAVAVSMWIGIDTNLWIAAGLYLLLTLPLLVMAEDRAAQLRRAEPDVARHATGAAM
jgi:hypothetical protein